MRIRGSKSDALNKHILELFVEHEQLRAMDVCNMLCDQYGITRRVLLNRLQRMRDTVILRYVTANTFGTADYMKLTLHGEYLLTLARRNSGEPPLVSKKLIGYIRWGQRRKNATSSSTDGRPGRTRRQGVSTG